MQIFLGIVCIGLNQEELIHKGGHIDGLQHKQLDSLHLHTRRSLWSEQPVRDAAMKVDWQHAG